MVAPVTNSNPVVHVAIAKGIVGNETMNFSAAAGPGQGILKMAMSVF